MHDMFIVDDFTVMKYVGNTLLLISIIRAD